MTRRLKLRHFLLILILFAGVVPLAINVAVLYGPNLEILQKKEEIDLTRLASGISQEFNGYLVNARRELEMVGKTLVMAPGPSLIEDRLRQDWVINYLENVHRENSGSGWSALSVRDVVGEGPRFADQLSGAQNQALEGGFQQSLSENKPNYRLVGARDDGGELSVVVSVPLWLQGTQPLLVLQAVVQPQRLRELATSEDRQEQAFLIDAGGNVVWSRGASPETERAMVSSPPVQSFVDMPLPQTTKYDLVVDGKDPEGMIGIVSPITEAGWGVVVHKPEAAAYRTLNRMVARTTLSSGILVLLALVIAFLASKWIGQPIQRLAEGTHAIAQGNFKSRVDTGGLRFELADLAQDFNAMGGHVERYVEQLKQAAQANRDLFIGSLRAFTAAIDAKDPYTRGHSERVAAFSRVIARQLGQPDDFQNRLWIAALMHDVGKIGIEDHVLKKGGVLTPEEYEQMKLHTVIGAEIIGPIEQLKEAVPVVRWHHEAWNGRGYPDGIKGEQIPLMARIVGVADTFDAITTNRPYQKAYTIDYAVETITKLTGARFDAKVVTAFLRAVDKGEIQRHMQRPESSPAHKAAQVQVQAAAGR